MNKLHFNVSQPKISEYAVSLYTAVYLFAHAATAVLNEGGDIRNTQQMLRMMKSISFKGIKGRNVSLDANGGMHARAGPHTRL